MDPKPTPTGGNYLFVHIGLLNDERFHAMSPGVLGAWTKLALLAYLEPERGWFRDRERAVWLLVKEGWSRRDAQHHVDRLDELGWFVAKDPDSTAVAIRGWHEWMARGLKWEQNQRRPTTREGRSSRGKVESGGERWSAKGEERRGKESLLRPRTDVLAPSARAYEGPEPLGDLLLKHGIDPDIVGKKPD